MQPDGQSPQPTRKTTLQATGGFAASLGIASNHADWPMRSGSLGPMPANSGGRAATAFAAAAGESTIVKLGAGLPEGLSDEPPQAASRPAETRTTTRAMVRRAV